MAQDEDTTPATREDLIGTLSFALRFDGRRRTHKADDFMARIAAEHLVDHLTRSGFVVSKRRPADPGPGHQHPYPHRTGSDE